MSALSKVVRAGVGRRRVQALVLVLTTMMAVTASVLAVGLIVASQGPFDHSFAQQRGAELSAQFDGGKVGAAQLAATAHASGVTAAAGPFPLVRVAPRVGVNQEGFPVGQLLLPLTVVVRADAGGPVDDLSLLQGHWPTGPGQLVISSYQEPFGLGDHFDVPALTGDPALTVVGVAASASNTADGWVLPSELPALTAPGAVPDQQLLYRFQAAGTDAQLLADSAVIRSAVPPGAMTGAASYLTVKLAADRNAAEYVPFLVAFGALGLSMSVLVIGIVVSGSVGASTRRIGILKSLGFTPAQVVRAYVGQALVPATVGTLLGVLLGNLAAVPVLDRESGAIGGSTTTIAPWIDLVVPAVALGAVALTALLPALRAGRLRSVEAIAVGRTPRPGRGRTVQRLLGRLPLPRPVTLGLGTPFARPGRSLTIAAAVVLGTVGVTFGVGLGISLNDVQNGLARSAPGDVVLQPVPSATGGVGDLVRQAPAIGARIAALPGTARYFSTGQTTLSVGGLAGPTEVVAYSGDSSWGSYQLVAGSWFAGPGQAVVPSGFLRATGTRIGDTVTLTNGGRSAPVRIVGEAFTVENEGMVILTDSASLTGLDAPIDPMSVEYDIDLRPGTDQSGYLNAVDGALQSDHLFARAGSGRINPTILAMDGLVTMLTVMLLAVAGLGVLNTVLLDTRERVHDLGVLKALGMSPRQTVATVVLSVAGTGLVAGLVGLPIGILVQQLVVPTMGTAAGATVPTADLAVYSPAVLLPLLFGGLVIATAGALLPAGWAARTRTATALRTE